MSETAQIELRSGRVYAPATAALAAAAALAATDEVAAAAAAAVPVAAAASATVQGLTLVHFSAQPEPFLTQNTP